MVSERSIPEPIGPDTGGTDPGPRNKELDRQNPDILTPPTTDSGTLPNLKFSFALAHNRLQKGGWTRQVTARELPIATTLAGVNMRLNAGGYANCTGTRRQNGRICSPDEHESAQ